MICILPTATYTCSNASGTTCTKVSMTVGRVTANTVCPATEYAALSSSEKAAYDSYQAAITTLQTQIVSVGSGTSTGVATVDFPPFNLSLEDGGAIGAAILLVWAVGFGFRMLIRALSVADVEPSPES